ncbi:MAG TPA: HAD family hydrolase [Dongiaceae bacterium]|jgi:phosphoglycolate phosphatase|nr:HAD family hydrolase [Dongiaceae bacterium]
MPRPRAILFDWDNTLVDSWDMITAAMNAALASFSLPLWDRSDTEKRALRSMRDSFPEIFGARWREAGEIYSTTFAALHLDHLRPLPGAEAALESVSRQGIYAAIVSNKRGVFLRKEVVHLGWEGMFGALVGAGEAERDKPAPDHAWRALAPSGSLDCVDVWFVGDTAVDIACAQALGARPVLCRPAPPHLEEFGVAGITHIESIADLARLWS